MWAVSEFMPFRDIPMTILWLENCLETVLWSKKHLSRFAVNEELVEYILMGSAWLNLPGRGGGTANYMSCRMGLEIDSQNKCSGPQSLKEWRKQYILQLHFKKIPALQNRVSHTIFPLFHVALKTHQTMNSQRIWKIDLEIQKKTTTPQQRKS